MNSKCIVAYKAFDKDLKTLNNITFEVGVPKHIDGEIKSGPVNGNGFHFCMNFEDTFRYVQEDPILCEVICYGEFGDEYIDDYNEYYEIYACSDMKIKRIIPREEIIEMAKKLPDVRLMRFISTYKMTESEIAELEKTIHEEYIKDYIDYYQRDIKKKLLRR